MNNKAILFTLTICLFCKVLLGDIKSTTGQIKFDVDQDGQAEMILNQTGVGIGESPSSNLHVDGNAMISDALYIGEASNSNLNVLGSVSYSPVTISLDTSLNHQYMVMANSSSDNLRLTLPYAANVQGRTYHIKKIIRDNFVIVKGSGNLIDDAEALELKNHNNLGYPSVTVISAEGQWWKINEQYVSDIIAAENLIRWYKLDETSDTHANDSSETDAAGVLLGGFDFSTSSIAGKQHLGLNFDASDNRVEVDDLDLPSNYKFSVSLWMNTTGSQTGSGSIGYLITKDRYHGNSPYNMSISSTNKYQCTVSGDSISSSPNINDGDWHHCVMVIDGTTMYNYLDGELEGSRAIVHDQSNDDFFTIGSSDDTPSYRPFSGNIDDVRVFNKALSSSEISKIYEAAGGNN